MRGPRLYLITEPHPDLVERVGLAVSGLPPGSVAIQLRDKQRPARELLALARELLALCRRSGQRLLVNDRLDVALAAGADGVHLPSAGVPPAEARRLLGAEGWIGASCHAEADVRRALEAGADFATFGPIFDTPSKRAYGAPVGLEALRRCAGLGLPLVALGGIDLIRAPAAIEAGAHGLAAIRAWLAAPDPAEAVRRLLAASLGHSDERR